MPGRFDQPSPFALTLLPRGFAAVFLLDVRVTEPHIFIGSNLLSRRQNTAGHHE